MRASRNCNKSDLPHQCLKDGAKSRNWDKNVSQVKWGNIHQPHTESRPQQSATEKASLGSRMSALLQSLRLGVGAVTQQNAWDQPGNGRREKEEVKKCQKEMDRRSQDRSLVCISENVLKGVSRRVRGHPGPKGRETVRIRQTQTKQSGLDRQK